MGTKKSWLAMVGAAALSLGVLTVDPAGTAHAAGPPTATPTWGWAGTTALPDPSEALALDRATHRVFAMTEAEGGGEGEVDTDLAVLPPGPNTCGEDVHDIAVMNGDTGAVERYIAVSGESEYMAVDPALGLLYVPQYNDEGLAAPQCVAAVNIGSDRPGWPAWTVKYYSIPFTYGDTGYQYDPTGVAVDPDTHIAYVGAKMPEIEPEGEVGGDTEFGFGAIMAFDGNAAVAGAEKPFLPEFVPAGDDPESVVFNRAAHRVYAANEDEGTLTIAPAVTRHGGAWDQTAFIGDHITLGPIFNAADCPPGTYQPAEADKMVVDDRVNKNVVYLTDDRFRVARIPGDAVDMTGVQYLNLPTPTSTCPTGTDPEVYNWANNLVLAPHLGAPMNGGKAGLLYVTSENHHVTVVDLSTFDKTWQMSIADGAGATAPVAGHIDWPVLNPDTNRFYVSDETKPNVYIYNVGSNNVQTK